MRKTLVLPLLVALGASDALVPLAVVFALAFGVFGPLGWHGIPTFAAACAAGGVAYLLFTTRLPGCRVPGFIRAMELGGSVAIWAGYEPQTDPDAPGLHLN
ncbi:hypothetical protein ACTVZO_45310 [Streptomyces sp. IBSNAI002]|uniref:hypothetical protein n=1 Tax=Streptomyces sp. IBSNAI002 TaxID=3457500 RepID=UPI003FD32FC4